MSLDESLPPAEEQQWLLDELAALVAVRGVGALVRSPILLPTGEFFPDKWTPDASGVRRLCRRLLGYAGLGELRAEVVTYTNPTESVGGPVLVGGHDTLHRTAGAAGWFAGIEEGCCRFGIDTNQIQDADAVVGTMCHEVAHAFRTYHQLVHDEREKEELLTDLTTIFLGFGVLTANSAYLHRSEGSLRTYTVRTAQAGYLLPDAMCFLLAAQAVVRRLSELELRRLRRSLEITQESYFKAAYKALALDAVALARRLGIPSPEQWPEVPNLYALTRPFTEATEDSSADEVPAVTVAAQPEPFNQGQLVFRVRQPRTSQVPMLFLGGLFALAAFGSGSYRFAVGMALGTVGLAAMHRQAVKRVLWECSEPNCTAPIPEGAEVCAGCGGRVAGTLRSANDRLAAREALLGEEDEPITDLAEANDEANAEPEGEPTEAHPEHGAAN